MLCILELSVIKLGAVALRPGACPRVATVGVVVHGRKKLASEIAGKLKLLPKR